MPLANCKVKKLVGISYDVLVKVDNFIFLANFIVLDCEVDFEMAIIFGRLFLAIGRAFVDMERRDLKFRLTNKEVTFNVHITMK